jgi:hypothetical protein
MGIVTYYQLNKDYIAEVLCINRKKPELQCNGKCFLKQKIEQTSQEEEKKDIPATQQDKVQIQPFLVSQPYIHSNLTKGTDNRRHFLRKDNIFLSLFCLNIFHPPQV